MKNSAATCSGKEIRIGIEEDEEDEECDYGDMKIAKSCVNEFSHGELMARIKCFGICIAPVYYC